MEKTCKQCGEKFNTHTNNQIYCGICGDNLICCIDGCEQKVIKYKNKCLCNEHYREERNGKPVRLIINCLNCGKEIKTNKPTQKFCSKKCKDKWHTENLNDNCKLCHICHGEHKGRLAVSEPPTCMVCYGDMRPSKIGICENCGEEAEIEKNKKENIYLCHKCRCKRYKRPSGICIICDEYKEIKIRDESGNPICDKCYKKHKQPKEICSKCHRLKIVNKRIENGMICKSCYSAWRAENDEAYYVERKLRRRLNSAIKTYAKDGKVKSSSEYGIDFEAIVKFLGPCPGPRENYHVDHIIALCKFDFNDPEQIKLAFAPENHQWLTKEENLKKGSK